MVLLGDLINAALAKKEDKKDDKYSMSREEFFTNAVKKYFKENKMKSDNIEVINGTFFIEITVKTSDEETLEVINDFRTYKAFLKEIWTVNSKANEKSLIDWGFKIKTKKKDEDFDFTTEETLKQYQVDIYDKYGLIDNNKIQDLVWKTFKMWDDSVENPNRPRKVTVKRIYTNPEDNNYYVKWTILIEFDKAVLVNWQWVKKLFPQHIIDIKTLRWYPLFKEDFTPFYGKHLDTEDNLS